MTEENIGEDVDLDFDLDLDPDYILDDLAIDRMKEDIQALVLDVANQRFKIRGITPLSCSFLDANYKKDGIIYSSFEEEEDDEI